jgi:hypothetical protein
MVLPTAWDWSFQVVDVWSSLVGWLPFVQIWFYLAMDSLCLCQKKIMFPKRCLEHNFFFFS